MDDKILYLGGSNGTYAVEMIDLNDPANPDQIGGWNVGAKPVDLLVDHAWVYAACNPGGPGGWSGLKVAEFSSQGVPTAITSAQLAEPVGGIAVIDGYALVANGQWGVAVVRISEGKPSTVVATIQVNAAADVAVAGSYAFIAANSGSMHGIQMWDISDLEDISLVDANGCGGYAGDVAVYGSYVLVCAWDAGLAVYEWSESGLTLVDEIDTPYGAGHLSIVGSTAYVSDTTSIQVFSLADIETEGVQYVNSMVFPADVVDVAASDYALVGVSHDMYHGYYGANVLARGTAAKGVDVVGQVDTPDVAYDLLVADDLAYVADVASGVQIVDLSNPEAPTVIGSIATDAKTRGVALRDGLLYVADGNSGIRIVDVTDPEDPQELGALNTAGQAQNIALSGNVACVADRTNGMCTVDVSDPEWPELLGTVSTTGLAYAVALVDSSSVALVAAGTSGLLVVSIANPSIPAIIGQLNTPGDASDVEFARVGETDCALVADGEAGVQVIDIDNPTSPQLLSTLHVPGVAVRLCVVGSTVYVAEGLSGVLVADISSLIQPTLNGMVQGGGLSVGVAVHEDMLVCASDSSGVVIWPANCDASKNSRYDSASAARSVSCGRVATQLAEDCVILRFGLHEPSTVSCRVYDVAGRFLRELVNADLDSGAHEMRWDARDARHCLKTA